MVCVGLGRGGGGVGGRGGGGSGAVDFPVVPIEGLDVAVAEGSGLHGGGRSGEAHSYLLGRSLPSMRWYRALGERS